MKEGTQRDSSVGDCYIRNLDTREEMNIIEGFTYYLDGSRYPMRCEVSCKAHHSKWHFNDVEIADDWMAPSG